jgi:3-deoxy-7-phosphoheptulonate synthase
MTSIVRTEGNDDVHIVLRGGNDGPNYAPVYIEATREMLAKKNLKPTIMVDCSHANSNKDHRKQGEVLDNVLDQIAAGENVISSLMIESNLEEGNQPIQDNLADLRYGVSITDKCVSWDETVAMLRRAHARLKEMGGRKVTD